MMRRFKQLFQSKTTQIFCYVYLIWFAINLYALAYGLTHPSKRLFGNKRSFSAGINDYVNNTEDIYPFESISLGTYDVSEFCAYTIAIPLIAFSLFQIYKIVRKVK